MIVELDLEKQTCKVIRESNDPRFRSGGWSDAESTFLYHVKRALQDQGFDVIKKRAWRDVCLVDNHLQYIRERSGAWCIYNANYAIFDAGIEFNNQGLVYLTVETLTKKESE